MTTAPALDAFLIEKAAFSFGDARRSVGSFLQRFRRAAPAAQQAAQQASHAYQQVPSQFRREVIDLSGIPNRGTMYRQSQVPQTMHMRTPVPGVQTAPSVHVAPTNAAERPTVFMPGGPPKLQPTVQMSPQAFPQGHPGRNMPPPVPQHVRDASVARAQAQTPRASASGYGGVRGSQRDYEVINGRKDMNAGLGGMLMASPEGHFLHSDPRFRHLLHSDRIEELDALAHGLMAHQQGGGAINAQSAMSVLQSPQYQRSLQHFKYSSLRRRGGDSAAQLFAKSAAPALPEGMNYDEEPGHVRWSTPSGHTVRMPLRDITMNHHVTRLGDEGAKGYLQASADKVNHSVDSQIASEQASWFNQNPRKRNALVGGATGALFGGMLGSVTGRPALGTIGGAGVGALLGQLGPTHIRKGPEFFDYAQDRGMDSVPSAFYHMTPEEKRQKEHAERMEQYARDAAFDRSMDRMMGRRYDPYGRYYPYY